MHKKYIFVDIDGTIFDHSTQSIPESTKKAFKLAKENGHEIIINTGRPPCLFYGIDKELYIDSYVAANGRYAVHKGEVILNETMNIETIKKIIDYAHNLKIDLGFQGIYEFTRQSTFDTIYIDFSNNFHLKVPEMNSDFYLSNDIYQMTLYTYLEDYTELRALFPTLNFAYSCKYGIDVNSSGGLKEEGIKAFKEKYGIPDEDIIAIGDGHNDISMFEYVKTSVAMGNAHDDVKKYATIVTDDVSNDGLYKAFKTLKLI